jgi:hypothetical protein
LKETKVFPEFRSADGEGQVSEFQFKTQAEWEALDGPAREIYEAAVRKQWKVMVAEDQAIRQRLNPSMYADDTEYTVLVGE